MRGVRFVHLTGYSAKLRDEVCVIAKRFAVQLLQTVQDRFNTINRGQDKGHDLAGDRHAVAKFAHQAFGGVSQGL